MRSPVVWFGGKSRLAKKIVALMPEHQSYVEVFGGGASVLFAKVPSPYECYNDLDDGLVNFFRVIRNGRKRKWLRRMVARVPYSRVEYNHFRKTWEQSEGDVERAYKWFVLNRMAFGGIFGNSWGFNVHRSARGMASCVQKLKSATALLEDAAERLSQVVIENKDWREMLIRFDSEQTLFYLDPPYVPKTRRGGEYKCELTMADHVELIERIQLLKGKVILSGYACEEYEPLERAGWRREDHLQFCHVNNPRGTRMSLRDQRTESLWWNYETATAYDTSPL